MKAIKKYSLSAFLLSFLGSVSAAAQEAAAPVSAPTDVPDMSFSDQLVGMLPMVVMIFFIFYFFVIRPQSKQIKEHEAMLSSLKKGDEVVTTGGVFGKVAGIEKDHILLEVAVGVKVKVLTSNIAHKAVKDKKE